MSISINITLMAAGLCLLGGLAALVALFIIDIRKWLLPNSYIIAFAIFGVGFHTSLAFQWLTALHMLYGMIVGGGLLFAIRGIGNWYYGAESLGLGDIKLFMAGGIWLGPEGILDAMVIGALAGIVYGLIKVIRKRLQAVGPVSLRQVYIPAGPGFIIGILAAGLMQYHDMLAWP